MSAPSTGRCSALAALPLALAGAGTSTTAAPSPVLRQALHVLALHNTEMEAHEAAMAVEGTTAAPAANAAAEAAFQAWAAGMRDLAAMPAGTPHDVLAKVASILWALRDGPAPPEREAATAAMGDLWRLLPELRPVLRWTPQDVPAGA